MYSRLTKIDDSNRGDHYYLDSSDECYFLGEYTARKGFSFSETNNLIINLKKKPDTKTSPQWKYKLGAIQTIATDIHEIFGKGAHSAGFTWVAIPPSKAKTDPMHDSRMADVLDALKSKSLQYDCRDLITQTCSTLAAHECEDRPNPEQIENHYLVNEECLSRPINTVILFDDVLTTGAHFKAAKRTLQRRLNNIRVLGIFVARRTPESSFFALDMEDCNF